MPLIESLCWGTCEIARNHDLLASAIHSFLTLVCFHCTVSGLMNIILSVAKLGVGVTCHSTALIADAGHSLSDLFSDVVTLWAVHVARLPPDQDHPHGHGKFEAIGALFLSLTLIVTSLTVGMASNAKLLEILALSRRTSTVAAAASDSVVAFTAPSLPALAMAVISIVSKEWLFRVTRKVGQQLQSTVVIANAWHHRSDAYSSVLAAASIGLAMYVPGFIFADAAAGLFVAAMIGMTGMEILGESILQLTDTAVAETNDSPESTTRTEQSIDDTRRSASVAFVETSTPNSAMTREATPALPQRAMNGEKLNDSAQASREKVVATATTSLISAAHDAERLESRVRDELHSFKDSILVRTVVASMALEGNGAAMGSDGEDRWIVNLSIEMKQTQADESTMNRAQSVARDIRQRLKSNSALAIDKVYISLDLSYEDD
jgi:cation diffusion facilitator family transporter